jgi:raffinose/stachyose/melibiose transport system permease protein
MSQTSTPLASILATSNAKRPVRARRKTDWNDVLGLYAIVAPTFILLAIFSLVPFVIAIATSFFDYEVGGDATFIGVSNYLEYLHDYTFLKSFANMFFLTAFQVIVVMIVPLAVAKLIFSLSSERASYFYRIVFLFPIVVPNVALYLIWRGVIYNEDGTDQQRPPGVWASATWRVGGSPIPTRCSGRSRSSASRSPAGSTS